MGWFGRKSTHKKQVDAAFKVVGNLYDASTTGRAGAPLVLRFALPDSRFRYMMFCLSTVQAACARLMRNPDTVLNELGIRLVYGIVATDSQQFFGQTVDVQHAANVSACLQDYLHRWSAYVDMVRGGSRLEATNLICEILRSTESADPTGWQDIGRLLPLARWIEGQFDAMATAFSNMAR